MSLKKLYFILCALGAVLPFSIFIPWVVDNGLDIQLFVAELFSTRIGAFFGLDVLVSAAVLFAFIFSEGRRLAMTNLWIPVVATVGVGVSLGFPLFLYLRDP